MKDVLKKLQFKLQQEKQAFEARLLELNATLSQHPHNHEFDLLMIEQAQLIEALLIIDMADERIARYED